MDWIKVKTNHALYEYNDLKDSEYRAWIKIMALTAQLEHEPTREQMLKQVNYQTLESLSRKLHGHSIDLSSILHKVLIDVAEVAHKREYWKNKKKETRCVAQNVHMDIQEKSTDRLDKIREDKNKETKKRAAAAPFILPEWEGEMDSFIGRKWAAYSPCGVRPRTVHLFESSRVLNDCAIPICRLNITDYHWMKELSNPDGTQRRCRKCLKKEGS